MPHIKNPYSHIVNMMRQQGAKDNPQPVQLAVVISAEPTLIIKLGDLQLDSDNLLIADYLLDGYQRIESLSSTPATGTTDIGSVTSIGYDNGTVTYKTNLSAGDVVAVLPTADQQTYIVFCKVVSQ